MAMVVIILAAAMLVPLWRVIAMDGYGHRPAPRSHRGVDDVDSWGMPTKHAPQH